MAAVGYRFGVSCAVRKEDEKEETPGPLDERASNVALGSR